MGLTGAGKVLRNLLCVSLSKGAHFSNTETTTVLRTRE